MKDYELKIKLEDELRWATHKYGVFDSKVNNAKEALKPLLERHRLIEEEERKEIVNLEENKAIFFDIVKEKQLALDNIGKSFCQFCERAFAPQGIKAHEASCTSNPANIKAKPKPVTEVIEETQVETITEIKKAINQNHAKIVNGNQVKCPECLKYFAKGGAFAAHYKTHFPNNGNGGE